MPGVDRDCVTHHHACDCREARFRAMEEALAYMATFKFCSFCGFFQDENGKVSMCGCDFGKIARECAEAVRARNTKGA